MATNAVFLAAIQDMHVTGLRRHYEEPPAALSTADLPAGFPLMPSGGLGELVVSCIGTNKVRRIRYAIAVEAAGQGTIAQNYGKLAAHMDNLETALDALTVATFIEYDITTGTAQDVAGNQYWAVLADVTARDI